MHKALDAMIGFGQGFQPVCGISYGARLHGRIKEAFSFCVRSSFLVLLAMSVTGFIFAGNLVGFFRNDPDVISIGREALLGLRGMEMAQMITDFIGLLIAYPFCRSFLNEIGVGQKNGSPRISGG